MMALKSILPLRRKGAKPSFYILHFTFYILLSTVATAEIFTRLSPSRQGFLESVGATLLSTTPVTVNGTGATLSSYAFLAAPNAAGAEVARLLNLPAATGRDGLITRDKNTHLIVLPAATPRESLLLLTQRDAAPAPRAIEFPKGLPHPADATPTFAATLDATQTSFAAAISAASPEALHADMRRRLLAQRWQAALPATASQSIALYARGNATFVVFTAPAENGFTRLSLLQRLTSN